MPYSPLISKIRCHNPNRTGSKVANKNYLIYIATREGVDISCCNDFDSLFHSDTYNKKDESYTDKKFHETSENDEYLYYIAKRERSHGLFGNVDTSDLSKIAKQVGDITKKGRCIYRGIISLSEKDALALNFTNKEQWNLYMQKVMPDIAKELGISMTNFTWVAAFHAEQSHPHVHYELWDNSDKVKSPFIHTSVQQKCRRILSDAMFDEEYENMIKEVFKVERNELNSIRNQSRTQITSITKDIMDDINSFVPGINSNRLPDRISIDEVKVLSNLLIKLSHSLPVKGSTDYAYLSSDLKKQVNNITSTLLERNDLSREFKSYLNAVEEGNKLIGKTDFEIKIIVSKAEKDLNTRIGNILIKEARLLKEKNLEYVKFLSTIDNSKYQYNENNSEEVIIPDPEPQTKIEISTNNYYCKWTNDYKKALNYLYKEELQNYKLAHEYLSREAKKGNVLAIYDLAKLYEKGLGTNIDISLSNVYYQKSLEGFLQLENIDSNKYLEYRIGKFYDAGKGISKDQISAASWYTLSSDKNYKYAEYSLAKLYMKGIGINKELVENGKAYIEAHRLFIDSAKQDNAYASYELGNMYKKGIGCIENQEKSFSNYSQSLEKFLDMSKERADDTLLYRIGKMYYEGLGTNINIDKAIEFFEKSAKLNNELAQYTLANHYINSENPDPDKVITSIKCLERLSEHNVSAQYALGKLFLEGKFVDVDINKAIEFFTKAANKENDFAQFQLGRIYSNNEFKQYDIEKSLFWLNKSAEANNPFAQCYIGNLYLWGNKVDKNEEQGLYWLNRSNEQGNEFAKESISAYENYTNNFTGSLSYCLVKNIYNFILQEKEKEKSQNSDRRNKSKSKAAQKEEILRQQVKGNDNFE